MKKCLLSGCAFAFGLGLSSQSMAQNTRGLWIAGGADVFQVYKSKEPQATGAFSFVGVEFGISGSDLAMGYQFHQHFLVAARFGAKYSAALYGTGGLSGHFGLHIQVPFLTGTARPFLLIEPGILTFQAYQQSTQQFDQTTGFRGLFGVGVHLFAAESFSISPYGALLYENIPDKSFVMTGGVAGVLISGWVWKK